MDWQVLQDGLRAWVASALGISVGDVAWDGEADAYRSFPRALLQLDRQGTDRANDEVRYEPNELGQLVPVVYGQRILSLKIIVRSRDQRGNAKAYALIERLRLRLELPASLDVFETLGVVVREVSTTGDAGQVSDMREESSATLSIVFGYVEVLRDVDHPAEPIERVEVSGTVQAPETIEIPETVVP